MLITLEGYGSHQYNTIRAFCELNGRPPTAEKLDVEGLALLVRARTFKTAEEAPHNECEFRFSNFGSGDIYALIDGLFRVAACAQEEAESRKAEVATSVEGNRFWAHIIYDELAKYHQVAIAKAKGTRMSALADSLIEIGCRIRRQRDEQQKLERDRVDGSIANSARELDEYMERTGRKTASIDALGLPTEMTTRLGELNIRSIRDIIQRIEVTCIDPVLAGLNGFKVVSEKLETFGVPSLMFKPWEMPESDLDSMDDC